MAPIELNETHLPAPVLTNRPPLFALAADSLRLFWHSLARRAARRDKSLVVRETAVLGDRRFVSVIQFERQRFLIASSPSSITLLSPLPDEPANGAETAESAQQSKQERGANC